MNLLMLEIKKEIKNIEVASLDFETFENKLLSSRILYYMESELNSKESVIYHVFMDYGNKILSFNNLTHETGSSIEFIVSKVLMKMSWLTIYY